MTSPDSAPDFLKCISCREIFLDPMTLHCGHTFCSKCVKEFASQAENEDKGSIKCPVCRRESEVPPSETARLSGQIGSSLLINRLAEDVLPEKGGNKCSLCIKDGETNPADIWCSTCGHSLCSSCQRVHDKLHPPHEIADMTPETPRTRQAKCDKHADSSIDLFCEDCETAVCQKCCILEHRNCKTVTPLEESKNKFDQLLEQYSKELENEIPNFEAKIASCETQIETLSTSAEDAERSINETCDELVAEINKQRDELKMKLQHVKEENLERLRGDVKMGEMTIADAKQRMGLAHAVRNSPSATEHYEIYKIFATLRGTKDHFKTTGTDTQNESSVEFVDNKSVLLASLQKRKIGYLRGSEAPENQDGEKIKIDTGFSGVHGIAVLTFEGIKVIVVTNSDNKLVQSFHSHLDQIHTSSVRLDHGPHDITKLSASKVATTVPKKKQILVFRVNPNLEKDTKIKTQLRYTGLTCLDENTLAASGEESPFIDIIDMSGTRLRSFGADIFSKPLFLCTTLDNNILVSDVGFWRIVCVSDEGKMEFEYNPTDRSIFGAPSGVCQGVSGDIFVVDRSHHKIVQLDQTGQFLSDFLTFEDEISDPCGLCVDDDNIMYVTVDDRYIHVHQLSEK